MDKRNIVAVITHNGQGGAQEGLSRLCKTLTQRGHRVTLWYLYRKSSTVSSDLPVHFVLDKQNPAPFDYLKMPFLLLALLWKRRPDAIISFLPLANIMAQTVGWVVRTPVRIASQRNPVQTYSWLMQFADWYLGTVGCYTTNVLNSSDVNDSVKSYPWPYRFRTHIIHNGIQPNLLSDVARSDARLRFQLAPTETALVSVGRLSKQKNQAFLIQLLGDLKEFRLFLAGSGPELSRLRLEATRMGVSDRVTFLGSLSQSDTKLLLSATDIFVLPSLYEGQSNALLEAMSAGKPIVTSDIPSHRETLIGAQLEAGFVIPITEPEKWLSTLRSLARDATKREKFGGLAQRRAQFFSLDRMCTAFETTIEKSQLRVTRRHHDRIANVS
jgi:glycosyltransferase involved in cell wall biosynthesis